MVAATTILEDTLCIKGGIIVNHDSIFTGDILISQGIIRKIEKTIEPPPGAKIIEANGKFIFPGGVDCDCRLIGPTETLPTADNFNTGSLSALCGGTTTIINEIAVWPGSSLVDTYEKVLADARDGMHCDYNFKVCLPEISSVTASEMKTLACCKRVASFAFNLCTGANSNCFPGLDEDAFINALQICASLGVLPSVSATGNPTILAKLAEAVFTKFPDVGPEGSLWASPERFEADTISRVALFASQQDCICPILFTRVHSKAALQCLINHRRLGRCLLFGETSAVAFGATYASSQRNELKAGVLQDDWSRAAGCVSDPPIRPDPIIARRLLTHLSTGDLVAVGSAHRAVSTGVRAALGLHDFRRIPTGTPTAGTRLSVLWKCGVEIEAVLDPCSFVASMSTNAARLFNIYPRKGRIAVGSDADLLIWNSDCTQKLNSKLVPDGVADPFEGLNLPTCRPDVVLLRGKVVVHDGQLVEDVVKPGIGLLIPSDPFGEFTFGRVGTLVSHCDSLERPVEREAYTGAVINVNGVENASPRESYFYRKEFYDNTPKEALPPGQRVIHTSVKTAHPPGGSSNAFWWNS